MKRSLLLLSCFCAFAINDLLAAPPSYIQTKDGVIVFTDPAVVDLKTGGVTFLDCKGKKILAEKQPLAGRFQPVVFEGKPYYALTQTFQSTTGDAWYGLGQHQDGILNYRHI